MFQIVLVYAQFPEQHFRLAFSGGRRRRCVFAPRRRPRHGGCRTSATTNPTAASVDCSGRGRLTLVSPADLLYDDGGLLHFSYAVILFIIVWLMRY